VATVNGDVCGSMVWLCLIGAYGIALGVLVLGATLGYVAGAWAKR